MVMPSQVALFRELFTGFGAQVNQFVQRTPETWRAQLSGEPSCFWAASSGGIPRTHASHCRAHSSALSASAKGERRAECSHISTLVSET